jgi:hypothetical protein
MNFPKFIKSISLCLAFIGNFAFASGNTDLTKLAGKAPPTDNLEVQSVYSIGSAGDHLGNQAGNNYNSKNMVDGNVKTVWALTYGSGEVVLQFNLKKQATFLSRLLIYNGYGKSIKRFHQNSRAKKIGIYVNGTAKKNLVREWELADQMDWQTVILNVENVNSVYIRVHSIYPGSTWLDLCISEVKFEGASSDIDAEVSEPKDEEQRMDGFTDLSLQQKIALTPAQAEQISQRHYFVLTQSQKNLLHKKWDRDTLSILPSNWYDCSCFMYRVDWFHKDSVLVPRTFMPSREVAASSEGDEEYDDIETEFGPYSRGLIMGIDGKLYQDGNVVSLADLVAKQKAEKKAIVYERNYECVESGYSIDFPPVEVIGEKTLKKFKKALIKAGLKFCEMIEE